jgi:ribosomal protein L11 methyltransferase
MRWAEISIAAPVEASEAVTAHLLEIGCSGVSESGPGPIVLTGHLPASEGIQRKLEDFRQRLDQFAGFGLPVPGEITLRYVEDADWANEWKKYFRPIEIGDRLVIKPSWETYSGDSHRLIVELDPGMAFGTGGHPSTRLSLIGLERNVSTGYVVADIGTGSGILALAAAKLGAATVHATDIDSLARKIARENVDRSGMGSVIQVHEIDVFDREARNCDVVVANIIADAIVELTPSVRSRLRSGGVFISAGIVEERLPDVLSTLSDSGFEVMDVLGEDIWRCVIARAQ